MILRMRLKVSVHEKLLEALTNRFELYAPLQADAVSSQRCPAHNPELAARLLASLADMTDRLLSLCGDEVTG